MEENEVVASQGAEQPFRGGRSPMASLAYATNEVGCRMLLGEMVEMEPAHFTHRRHQPVDRDGDAVTRLV